MTTRYPGEDETVTEPEAKRAIDIAVSVRSIVRDALLKGDSKNSIFKDLNECNVLFFLPAV